MTLAAVLFLTQREGGQQLVADVRGGDAGYLGVVVGGRDFHDVGADEVKPGEGAQRGEQFPTGQATCFWGSGAGGVRGVFVLSIVYCFCGWHGFTDIDGTPAEIFSWDRALPFRQRGQCRKN